MEFLGVPLNSCLESPGNSKQFPAADYTDWRHIPGSPILMSDSRVAPSDSVKSRIARNFSRAAAHYDAATPVQQRSAEALFALLRDFAPHFTVCPHTSCRPALLDVGVGSGRLFALAQRHLANFAEWELHGIDFAPQMLALTRKHWPQARLRCCDAERCDYPFGSYDLILSNFTLQWCEQPALLLQRLVAALRPSVSGGCLVVALPLRGSLSELTELLRQLSGAALPLHPLPCREDFAESPGEDFVALQGPSGPLAGRADVQVEYREQNLSMVYPSAYAALRAIKRAGAQTVGSGLVPLSYAVLHRLRQREGPFVVSYRVLFILIRLRELSKLPERCRSFGKN